MNTSTYKTNGPNSNNPVYTRHRSKRRSRHSKRRSVISQFFRWATLNPGKLIGILGACVIIYVSVLFYKYYKEQMARSHNRSLQIEPN